MAHVISVINQKGGVAKTITTAHLAVALSRQKKKVLCIDLDPQANLSVVLGSVAIGEKASTTIYDCLQPHSTQSVGRTYLDTNHKNVSLCYGSLRMSAFEIELITNRHLDPSWVIPHKIDSGCKDHFDYILIDCPPSLSSITTNALCASNFYLIPIAAGDSLALEGVEQLGAVVDSVTNQLNRNLQLLGVLLTKVERRLLITKSIRDEVKSAFGHALFDTVIRQNTQLEQATHSRQTIYEFDRSASGARDYTSFCREVIKRCDSLSRAVSAGSDPDREQHRSDAYPEDSSPAPPLDEKNRSEEKNHSEQISIL
jgi:chromosome partitioning protein